MAIKIEFEKAYDRIRWDFIKETLLMMQLPVKLVEVILSCVSTCSMSVLWNGTPLEPFRPTQGIREGDPLSPYLFVMCMEWLVHRIDWEVSQHRWEPIPVCRHGPKILNLLFADDLVLFAEATTDQARIISQCLEEFCAKSGQKINHAKSRVPFSANMVASDIDSISHVLRKKQSFNICKPQVQGVSLSTWSVLVRRELCFQLPEFTRASQSRRDQ